MGEEACGWGGWGGWGAGGGDPGGAGVVSEVDFSTPTAPVATSRRRRPRAACPRRRHARRPAPHPPAAVRSLRLECVQSVPIRHSRARYERSRAPVRVASSARLNVTYRSGSCRSRNTRARPESSRSLALGYALAARPGRPSGQCVRPSRGGSGCASGCAASKAPPPTGRRRPVRLRRPGHRPPRAAARTPPSSHGRRARGAPRPAARIATRPDVGADWRILQFVVGSRAARPSLP